MRDLASLAPWLAFGDFADAYAEESSSLSLKREDGKLEDIVQGNTAGVGLRWTQGRETRFGAVDARRPLTDGLTAEELSKVHKLAGDMKRGLRPAGRARLFAAVRRLHPVEKDPRGMPLDVKIKLLETAEKAARGHARIRQVTVSYGETLKKVGHLTGRGAAYEEERLYVTFAVQVTAEKDGRLQTGYEVAAGLGGWELFEKRSPVQIARLAARRAVEKLDAPPAPVGEMPVVIAAEAGGTLIHEAIGHALEADHIQNGSSPHFAGKIGRRVANDLISVLDDPTLTGNRGSFFFDDEGTPSERSVLVENGVLKTYLYDRMTAGRDKRSSNGHGRRESYAHKPIPRMSNTFIAPGKDDPEKIRRSLKRGLLVTRMGGGQVNTATGDFVFEVDEAFWVEKGRVKHRVRNANLLGNGPDVLKSIDRLGSDIGWSVGTCGKEDQGVPVSDGVPTLRIPKIVIGGVKE